MVRLCNKCGIEPRKTSKGGWTSYCKKCAQIAAKECRQKNKDERLLYEKKYRERTKESRSKAQKAWKSKNKDKVRKYNKNYFQDYYKDINNKLAKNLRNRLRQAIKKNYKAGSAVSDLGCSIDFFKSYLESKFESGMAWDNYGIGVDSWGIDHIKPLNIFKLTNREELLKACHYTNLQPMWTSDNSRKCNAA